MSYHYVNSVRAWEMAEGFCNIGVKLFQNRPVQLIVSTTVSGFELNVTVNGNQCADHAPLLQFIAEARKRPHIYATVNTGLYSPSQPQNEVSIIYENQNPETTPYRFNVRGRQDKVSELALVDALSESFNIRSLDAMRLASLPQVEQELLKAKIDTVDTLRSEVARLGQYLTDAATREHEAMSAYRKELDAEYKKRQDALDAQHTKLTADLGEKQTAFEKQKTEFETHTRTYQRRNIDKQLKTVLEAFKEIDVQKTILNRRWLIHVGCSLTLLGSGSLAGYAGAAIVKSQTTDWFHVLPFTTSLLLFGSTLVFYLKWQNNWFVRLAAAEFAHRKAQFDIARAAWLAELLFEWKETKEIGLPRQVLKSLSANLFVDPQQDKVDLHPVDSLASALRNISSLKVGNVEVEQRASKAKP